jgi:predicted extracellular nuclease
LRSIDVHASEFHSICSIQGTGFTSPYAGNSVRTQGIVYADQDDTSKRGFYLQDPGCDENPSSSDGIFIHLSDNVNLVNPGYAVEVAGKVKESYGMTLIEAQPEDVTILSRANPLPEPVELNPPDQESRYYFETHEGMYLRLGLGRVVGATNAALRSWLVRSDLGIERIFQGDLPGRERIICVSDAGNYPIDPQVKVGDELSSLLGALHYESGVYCLRLFAPAEVLQSTIRPPDDPTSFESDFAFNLATVNLAELFDTVDDPEKDDPVYTAAEYQRRLEKLALLIHNSLAEPDVIAVQEAENRDVLQSLVNHPEIQADYQIVWQESPDPRGLDVALLVREDRATLLDYASYQGCTHLVDGFGPDGNGDPDDPSNLITCDRDGDGSLDGNRLFSRPPLLVRLRFCAAGCAQSNPEAIELSIIVSHFKSKSEDTPLEELTLPRRVEEAEFVADLVGQLLAADPQANLVVAGDLNDFPDSQPLRILEEAGLIDLSDSLVNAERYSYNYQGVSQILDYLLVHLSQGVVAVGETIRHVNADFPVGFGDVAGAVYRSSDHDPVTAYFKQFAPESYLPRVTR